MMLFQLVSNVKTITQGNMAGTVGPAQPPSYMMSDADLNAVQEADSWCFGANHRVRESRKGKGPKAAMTWDVGEAEGSGGVGDPGSDEVREVDDEGPLIDHSKEPWRFAFLCTQESARV